MCVLERLSVISLVSKSAHNSSSFIFMSVAKGSFFLQASKFKTSRSSNSLRIIVYCCGTIAKLLARLFCCFRKGFPFHSILMLIME
jgi:hypothetical protein